MPLVESMLIKSKLKDYKVDFCSTNSFLEELLNIPNAFFVIDANVWGLYSKDLLFKIKLKDHLVLTINEERKTLDVVQEVYDEIIKIAPKKNLTIISIGGGIVQDITGFCASTLYRGVNWIYLPTTLLAQADSCIGAKTSLNYKNYKNLIGTFYPPSKVYIYAEFLKTLESLDFYSGIGEIAKLQIMGGSDDILKFAEFVPQIKDRNATDLFGFIQRSLQIKKSFIEEDEFDMGRRNLLNFGHCFGHAIESATDFAVPHGQAVVLGIILANFVALKRGILSARQEEFLRKSVLLPILTVDLKEIRFDDNAIIKGMKKDKKRTGEGLALVMVKDNYEMVKEDNISEAEALEALKTFRDYIVKTRC